MTPDAGRGTIPGLNEDRKSRGMQCIQMKRERVVFRVLDLRSFVIELVLIVPGTEAGPRRFVPM